MQTVTFPINLFVNKLCIYLSVYQSQTEGGKKVLVSTIIRPISVVHDSMHISIEINSTQVMAEHVYNYPQPL